jgi:hypothetical protein
MLSVSSAGEDPEARYELLLGGGKDINKLADRVPTHKPRPEDPAGGGHRQETGKVLEAALRGVS